MEEGLLAATTTITLNALVTTIAKKKPTSLNVINTALVEKGLINSRKGLTNFLGVSVEIAVGVKVTMVKAKR